MLVKIRWIEGSKIVIQDYLTGVILWESKPVEDRAMAEQETERALQVCKDRGYDLSLDQESNFFD